MTELEKKAKDTVIARFVLCQDGFDIDGEYYFRFLKPILTRQAEISFKAGYELAKSEGYVKLEEMIKREAEIRIADKEELIHQIAKARKGYVELETKGWRCTVCGAIKRTGEK